MNRTVVFAIGFSLLMILAMPAPVAAQSWGGGNPTPVSSTHDSDADFDAAELDEMTVESDSVQMTDDRYRTDDTEESNWIISDSETWARGTEVDVTYELDEYEDELIEKYEFLDEVEFNWYTGFEDEFELTYHSASGEKYSIIEKTDDGRSYLPIEEDPSNRYDKHHEYGVDKITVESTEPVDDDGGLQQIGFNQYKHLAPSNGYYVGQSHEVVKADTGSVDLELENADAEIVWEKYTDGSWTEVATETATTSGQYDLDLPGTGEYRLNLVWETDDGAEDATATINEESVSGESNEPVIDNLEPEDGAFVDEDPIELSADISDDTLHEDLDNTVDVEFRDGDGDLIDSQTISEDQTVTTDWTDAKLGTNEWYVVAEDDYGQTTKSDIYSFETPHELYLRDELDPDKLVDDTETEVEVTFFAEDEVITRTTNDGVVDLSGLPNDVLVVQADADEYVTRQTIIPSVTEQQDVFLLPETADQVATRFTLEDPTGQFDQRNTRAFVQKPIEKDGETTYETVAADQLGSQGWSTILHQDQRYRIQIEDIETGQTRSLGPYVATTDETVTLEVDAIEYEFEDEDIGYAWNAEYQNETDPSIVFAFDSEYGIEELTVEIRESGGEETILMSDSWSDTESVFETAIIPEDVDENTTTWIVEWEATIQLDDGSIDTLSGSIVVGPDQMPVGVPGVPDDVLHVVAVFLILAVAGLFSAANVEVGAIVTSLFAGFLWFIGMLPGVVSGILIALALMISVVYLARRTRGPR